MTSCYSSPTSAQQPGDLFFTPRPLKGGVVFNFPNILSIKLPLFSEQGVKIIFAKIIIRGNGRIVETIQSG
jgi:hypothetical protein